jgi:hypothetical protein
MAIGTNSHHHAALLSSLADTGVVASVVAGAGNAPWVVVGPCVVVVGLVVVVVRCVVGVVVLVVVVVVDVVVVVLVDVVVVRSVVVGR